jgi:hypothetical protein
MRQSLLFSAAALAFTLSAGASHALPVNSGGGLKLAIEANDLTEQAAYIIDGRPYCFYFDGWQGPGWYRCGYSWRRGLGWGGAYGWQGWTYAPYERRHGGDVDKQHERSKATGHEGTTGSKMNVQPSPSGANKSIQKESGAKASGGATKSGDGGKGAGDGAKSNAGAPSGSGDKGGGDGGKGDKH